MTIVTPTGAFPHLNGRQYTNITPFTIRDGFTYAESLEELRTWVYDYLIPHIDTEIGGLVDDWQEQVSIVFTTLAESLAAHDTVIDGKVASMEDYVDAAVDSIINATLPITAAIVYQALLAPGNVAKTYLDGEYVKQANGKIVESFVPDRLAAKLVNAGNVSRFIKRAKSGEALKIVAIGDSVLEGKTVANIATDGAVDLIAKDLATLFATTITAVNHAVSGRTAATSFTKLNVSDALNAKGDLYLISFGKNDRAWETQSAATLPVPGYPTNSSIAMIELMVRLIRSEVPKADIMIVAENPYSPIENAANLKLVEWNTKVKRVAATYGAEYVDAYAPFASLSASQLAAVVPDGTHPNTAGHRLIADTVLAQIPKDYAGPSIPAFDVPRLGLYGPENIDVGTVQRGWAVVGQPTATPVSGLTWINTGAGWAGTSPASTSVAGDYAEFVFTGSELMLELSTALADNLVATVTVDTVPTYVAKSFINGKQGPAYMVPVALGLDPNAQHTVRITLVSGVLRINDVAALKGGNSGDTVTVDLGSVSAGGDPLPTDGTILYMVDKSTAVPLPAGWKSMDVTFTGYVVLRVSGSFPEERLLNVNLRLDNVLAELMQSTIPPRVDATGFHFQPFTVSHTSIRKTAAIAVKFEARVQSAVKTKAERYVWALQAVCRRTS